jgi:hypothetical protein
MAIHVDQRRFAVVVDQVIVPDLLKQGARLGVGGGCQKRTGAARSRSPVLRRLGGYNRYGLERRHCRQHSQRAANDLRHGGYRWVVQDLGLWSQVVKRQPNCLEVFLVADGCRSAGFIGLVAGFDFVAGFDWIVCHHASANMTLVDHHECSQDPSS